MARIRTEHGSVSPAATARAQTDLWLWWEAERLMQSLRVWGLLHPVMFPCAILAMEIRLQISLALFFLESRSHIRETKAENIVIC